MNDFENKKKVNLAESGKNDQIRKKIYTLRTLRVKYWTLSYFQNRIYYGGNDYNSKISAIKPYKRANENSIRKAFKSFHSDWLKSDMTHEVGCVYLMVVVSILFHAEFERNDHREDVLHFIK